MCEEVSNVFFFFQAEDGIRDRDVTGVQTCALPISNSGGATGDLGVAACGHSDVYGFEVDPRGSAGRHPDEDARAPRAGETRAQTGIHSGTPDTLTREIPNPKKPNSREIANPPENRT